MNTLNVVFTFSCPRHIFKSPLEGDLPDSCTDMKHLTPRSPLPSTLNPSYLDAPKTREIITTSRFVILSL